MVGQRPAQVAREAKRAQAAWARAAVSLPLGLAALRAIPVAMLVRPRTPAEVGAATAGER